MKTKFYLIATFLFTIILYSSCKKGDTGPAGTNGTNGTNANADTRIYNKWQVISGGQYLSANYSVPNNTAVKYFNLSTDNTFYILMQDTIYGFKNYIHDLAFITSSQIAMSGGFNYSINATGDVLTLTNPILGQTIICAKNQSNPDYSQWLIPITAVDSVLSPNAISPSFTGDDIASDGQYLYITDGNYSSTGFYTIPLSSIHSSPNLIYYNNGLSYYGYPSIGYAGSNLWVTDYNNIHKIDRSSGYDYSGSPGIQVAPSGNGISGMAYDGTNLLCNYINSYGGSVLYKYNLSSTLITSFTVSFQINAMEYAGGYLYLYAYNSSVNGINIYKCTLSASSLQAVATYQVNIPGIFAPLNGLAYDGNKFWVLAQNSNNGYYWLYKLSL